MQQHTVPTAHVRKIISIPLNALSVNPHQPRKHFSAESIESLAASIRQYGLLSPLLVRKTGIGRYELIAGERRLRALGLLGLRCADAVVLGAQDLDSALIALVENVQRENLNFFEEAQACRFILENHALRQEELARLLGKSPSALNNRLRLLKLPEEIQKEVISAQLSERHARALLRLGGDVSLQHQAVAFARQKGLAIRPFEAYIEKLATRQANPLQKNMEKVARVNKMVVNAVLNTVRELKKLGVDVNAQVTDGENDVQITVRIIKNSASCVD